MKILRIISIILVYCVMLSAHTVDSTSIDTLHAITTDTLAKPQNATDNLISNSIADTLAKSQQDNDTLTDTSTIDTLPNPQQATKTAAKNEKTKLIKRNFNPKQQVGLGIGMMIFIAVIMTTAQSWNPKN